MGVSKSFNQFSVNIFSMIMTWKGNSYGRQDTSWPELCDKV